MRLRSDVDSIVRLVANIDFIVNRILVLILL